MRITVRYICRLTRIDCSTDHFRGYNKHAALRTVPAHRSGGSRVVFILGLRPEVLCRWIMWEIRHKGTRFLSSVLSGVLSSILSGAGRNPSPPVTEPLVLGHTSTKVLFSAWAHTRTLVLRRNGTGRPSRSQPETSGETILKQSNRSKTGNRSQRTRLQTRRIPP